MKIFVATDVHGSAYWADKIVEQFEKSHADLLVLLGDIYNHGPRNPFPQDYAPMKVAEILGRVSNRLIVVKGNCDSQVDQMISPFQFLSDYQICCGGRRLFFTHGHIYNKENLPKLSFGDAMFYGHFHKNEIAVVEGVTCVNISSCALPKDVATFGIVEEQGVVLYRFDGNEILRTAF